MKIQIEKVINFKDGLAEIFLPKGATNISIRFGKRVKTPYFCATVDANEKEEEKYYIFSFSKKLASAKEDGFVFLQTVENVYFGELYWYYKKA